MPPLTYTLLDCITDALIEIGIIGPGDAVDPDTGQWAFRKANYLIDTWQALERYVYSYAYTLYTLVPALSPHTIGPANLIPAPTFSTGDQPRPVRLESCALILNPSGTLVDIPMNIRDHDWWAAQQVKEIQTNIPTDVYYDPTSPLGSLYFWPVPNAQMQVRLQTWQTVQQFQAINDPIGGPAGPGSWPQGYRNAFVLTLAELLCPGAQITPSQTLVAAGQQARAAVFGNNAKSPRMGTRDSGMPMAGRRTGTIGDFNWMTGSYPGGPPE